MANLLDRFVPRGVDSFRLRSFIEIHSRSAFFLPLKGMDAMEFLPLPSRPPLSAWMESNRALARLITRHRPMLGRAFETAEDILRRMRSLFPTLDELRALTCPWCPTPCCIVNKVWLDFNDLLFMHLTQQPIPPMQLAGGPGETCRYLAHRGCLLPRLSRPWACTLYLCATQRRALAKTGRFREDELDRSIQFIKTTRLNMEAALARAITQKNRRACQQE